MAGYSYLIKNGTIIDGSGLPMVKGDLGISGGIIKHIGALKGSETATRVIDATGKYIMPGVIDITNHSDTHWTIFNFPSQESMLAQGITTGLGGLGSLFGPAIRGAVNPALETWLEELLKSSTAQINLDDFAEMTTG